VIAVVRPGERLWPGLSLEVSVLSSGPLCQVSARTERAEILAVNLAEGTYKVCLRRTGRTKVLRAMGEDVSELECADMIAAATGGREMIDMETFQQFCKPAKKGGRVPRFGE